GHDGVAGVDACGAADAFDLQPVTDVDPGGARLDAQPAVDAGAQSEHRRVRLARTRAARLAAPGVVADDQRGLGEQDTLEAGVRTHVLAHLLAHEPGVAVGGKAVEQDPERLPRPERGGGDQARKLPDRGEVADERESGPQREQYPDGVLRGLDAQLAGGHRRLVELHPLDPVALDPALDPEEYLRVDGLRTGVAAPEAPGDGGEQE